MYAGAMSEGVKPLNSETKVGVLYLEVNRRCATVKEANEPLLASSTGIERYRALIITYSAHPDYLDTYPNQGKLFTVLRATVTRE